MPRRRQAHGLMQRTVREIARRAARALADDADGIFGGEKEHAARWSYFKSVRDNLEPEWRDRTDEQHTGAIAAVVEAMP